MIEDTWPVVVADDEPAVREALEDLFEGQPGLRLIGTAGDHEETVSMATERSPKVVLLDVRMPKGTGPDTVRTLRRRAPDIRVLALSAYEDRTVALDMVEAGAVGYLPKGLPSSEILDAVGRAGRGQFSMPADLAIDCVREARRGDGGTSESGTASSLTDKALSRVLDGAPSAIVVVSPEGQINWVNTTAERVFGYSRHELVGRPVTILLPERFQHVDPATMTEPRTAMAQGFGEDVLGGVGRRKDGSEFPAHINLMPPESEGHPAALFFDDTTELHRAETRYQSLIESSPDAQVIWDAAGLIQFVNAEAADMLGYRRSELVGKRIDTIVPLPAGFARTRNGAPATGELRARGSIELTARRKDGSQFPVDVNVNPLETEEGLLVVTSIHDIGEVKRTLLALEQSLSVLQDADRMHHSMLTYLVRAQEEERERIAVGIHDDTIQVITAASLRLQQLKHRLRHPEDLEVLAKLDETIQLSISRLRQLIFELRPPALESAGLAAALRGQLEQMQTQAAITFHLDDELGPEPPLETRLLMFRIAQEALLNARKHAQATAIHVKLLGYEAGYLVRIEDDGVGYSLTEGDDKPGHLGMIAMQERAQMAGGWCRIETTPGSGTIVEFWIPRPEDHGGQPAAGQSTG